MALIINVEKGDINLEADEILDLTDKGLKKLEKCGNGNLKCLLLDSNELARLENVESYGDLLKLSVTNNKLVRMYGVCRLVHLRVLNLANNSIVAIEGMRELIHLTWLRLSGNKIKLIEHLSSNGALEYLDLSNNCVASLANLSHLKVLHTLILDDNNIKTIHHAANYLPATLTVLSLANNELTDLNQISYLCGLPNLENVSITNNPCVLMTGCEVGFDYRPFVINWCQNLKLLDGFMVGSKESLKAEWLYSMGKGRHFQPGEHAELAEYLSGVCPLTSAENLVSEEDAKLSRILNKRRQHQQQLLQELSSTSSSPPSAASPGSCQRRPATAPAHPTTRSASSTNLGAGVCGHPPSAYAVERSASASGVAAQLPNRMTASFSGPSSSAAAYVGGPASSAMSVSMSAAVQHHNKPVSPARHSPASKKKSSEARATKYVEEPPAGQFDLAGLMSRSYPGHYNGDDTTMFIVSPPDVPSDVPELGQGCDSDAESPLDGGTPQFILRSESQYVPVPETMLSPDFRPVPVSGGGAPFEAAATVAPGSDAQPQPQPPTPEPADARPRWLQRSAIPRSTFAHSPPPPSPSTGSNSQQQPQYDGETIRASGAAAAVRAAQARGSATDSPILRRPTQVLRLQRTARPLSLSPSSGRRSPAVPCRPFSSVTTPTARPASTSTAVPATTSSSDDDSTDSDVSVSKLALVREAAQTKMDAIVRRSMASSMESSLEGQLTNEGDSPSSSASGQPSSQVNDTVAGAAAVIAAKVAVLPMVNGSGGDDCWPRTWCEPNGSLAAVKVQALWRGFRARRYDPRIVAVQQEMRVRRAEDNVRHLTTELARARRDLDQERRLRELQMEAIRALWKEVQNLQEAIPDQEDTERATPCDSGLDSPNPTASTCPLGGSSSTTTQPTPTSAGGAAQPRRVGAGTTSTKAATVVRTASERSARSADESSPASGRARTSSGNSCTAPTRAGSSVAVSGKVASPRPSQRTRRRDVNDNYDGGAGQTTANGTRKTATREDVGSKLSPAAPAYSPPVEKPMETGEVGGTDVSAAEKMVHLTDTCSNLQTQVLQLQEALQSISSLLLSSNLQNKSIAPESLQPSNMNFCQVPPGAVNNNNHSPPFFSATASPLNNDSQPCALGTTYDPRQAGQVSPKVVDRSEPVRHAPLPTVTSHVNGIDPRDKVKGQGVITVAEKLREPTLGATPETTTSKSSIDRVADGDVGQRTVGCAEPIKAANGPKVGEGQHHQPATVSRE